MSPDDGVVAREVAAMIEADEELPDEAKLVILAALDGMEDPVGALEGAQQPPRRATPEQELPTPDPVGAFLTRITAQGFRGIGPAASLDPGTLAPRSGPRLKQGGIRIVHALGTLTLVNHRLNSALRNLPWTDEEAAQVRSGALGNAVNSTGTACWSSTESSCGAIPCGGPRRTSPGAAGSWEKPWWRSGLALPDPVTVHRIGPRCRNSVRG